MAIAFLSDKYLAVINALKTSNDSFDLVGGKDLVEFLAETRERNEFFSRLVIVDTSLTRGNEKNDLLYLKEYVETYSPSLELVLAIPRDRGSELADLFLSDFSAPMYSVAYLPKQTTIRILQDLVSLPVIELKAKYFSLDTQQVKENSTKKSKPAQKKKGFFAAFFGGGKKEEEVAPATEETPNQVPTPASTVVSEPLATPSVGAKPDLFAKPDVSVSTPVSSGVQNSIDSLFHANSGNTEEESGDLVSGTDSLNFSEFGDSHFQTGFIDEEEPDEPVANVSDGGWSSVDSKPVNDFSPVPENGAVAENSDFSPVLELEETNESKLDVVKAENFGRKLFKLPSDFDVLGVILVTGSESSRFLAEIAEDGSGMVILDTKSTLGVGSFISEKSYLENESEFYVEDGNTYVLNVPFSRLSSYINRFPGKTILINVSVSELDSAISSLNGSFKVLTVFNDDLTSIENQLLELEGVSPRASRLLVKGLALVQGGVSSTLRGVLEGAVFSKINWKGCFR